MSRWFCWNHFQTLLLVRRLLSELHLLVKRSLSAVNIIISLKHTPKSSTEWTWVLCMCWTALNHLNHLRTSSSWLIDRKITLMWPSETFLQKMVEFIYVEWRETNQINDLQKDQLLTSPSLKRFIWMFIVSLVSI